MILTVGGSRLHNPPRFRHLAVLTGRCSNLALACRSRGLRHRFDKQRGVVFDVGHGGASFDYTVAEPSSRKAARPARSPPTSTSFPAIPRACPISRGVISKFLGLGFPLEEVVAIATVDPVKLINRLPKLGTCSRCPRGCGGS
jgi:predicted amidohydrolase